MDVIISSNANLCTVLESQDWKLSSSKECSDRYCTAAIKGHIHECCKLAFCESHEEEHGEDEDCPFIETNVFDVINDLRLVVESELP